MGTTAEKLAYIKQTKQQLKTAINNKGGTLTDSDTFRDYVGAVNDIVIEQHTDYAGPYTVTQNGTLPTAGKAMTDDVTVAIPEYSGSYIVNQNGTLSTTGKVMTNDITVDVASNGIFETAWAAFKQDNPTNWTSAFEAAFASYSMRKYITDLTTLDFSGSENVTNMYGMFIQCPKLAAIPLFDTSACTNMSYMFRECSNLKQIPAFNTSAVKNFSAMFYKSGITSIPLLDTSSGTDMSQMFRECSSLQSVPALDTSKSTALGSFVYDCYQLKNFPEELDIASCTSLNWAFYGCSHLRTLSFINTSKLTSLSSAFTGCNYLTNLSIQDASGITNTTNAFANCSNLSTLNLPNIAVSFDIHWSSRFTRNGLLNIINNLADLTGGTAQTLTIGSTNLNKLTAEDIAIATNKNWTLA